MHFFILHLMKKSDAGIFVWICWCSCFISHSYKEFKYFCNSIKQNKITFPIQGVKKNLCYISCTCKHIYHKDLIFIAKLYAVYYLVLSFFSNRQPVKNTLIKTKFHTLVGPFCKIQIFFHKKFIKILKYW